MADVEELDPDRIQTMDFGTNWCLKGMLLLLTTASHAPTPVEYQVCMRNQRDMNFAKSNPSPTLNEAQRKRVDNLCSMACWPTATGCNWPHLCDTYLGCWEECRASRCEVERSVPCPLSKQRSRLHRLHRARHFKRRLACATPCHLNAARQDGTECRQCHTVRVPGRRRLHFGGVAFATHLSWWQTGCRRRRRFCQKRPPGHS